MVYKNVFEAIYWLAKEEVVNKKIKLLLQLLERLEVSDLEQFRTRSDKFLRKMLINLGEVLRDEVVQSIKASGAYGHQNVTFIKYYDQNIGDAKTVFIDTCDLLEECGEELSASAENIFNSLALLQKLGLLSDLKAIASYGTSVMT